MNVDGLNGLLDNFRLFSGIDTLRDAVNPITKSEGVGLRQDNQEDRAFATINIGGSSRNGGTTSNRVNAALDRIGEGQDMISSAHSGLSQIEEKLQLMRDTAKQAQDGSLSGEERQELERKVGEYAQDIDDIISSTTYGDKKLLDGLGDFGGQLSIPIGNGTGESVRLTGKTFGDVSVKDGELSGLAEYNQTANASVVDDAQSVLSENGAQAGEIAEGQTELLTGKYSVRVNYGGSNGENSTIELIDASGKNIAFAHQGTTVNTAAVDLSGEGAVSFSFGNGLVTSVNRVESSLVEPGQEAEATVEYAQQGDYTVDLGTPKAAEKFLGEVDQALGAINQRLFTTEAFSIHLDAQKDFLMEMQGGNSYMGSDESRSTENTIQMQLEALRDQMTEDPVTAALAHANLSAHMMSTFIGR